MKTLNVDLGDRSYPIYIGNDLLTQPELLNQHIPGEQVLLVSNETVAPLYLEQVKQGLSAHQTAEVILPDGEQYKTLDSINRIYDALLNRRFDRQCTLVALGGGVVGDITGFAAATYQRGVHFVQIPTTLLAQVDSSVGGKTGVNHPLGKNMIGAFYQPRCVIADTRTLNTLDDKQLSAGMAEVIKYGLIRDEAFFSWLENNMPALLQRDVHTLSEAIEYSCRCKAEVVAADEREAGQRALLNLGHTFGHAIESGMGYGKWLHGEAVATGMLMAADLSRRSGWLDQNDVSRIENLLIASRLPVHAPALSSERFMELMSIDKKVKQGKINLILMHKLGQAFVSNDYKPELLQQTLEQFPRKKVA
ncbi:MAG: 3-dehydroquinate synthase [Gammaproteobacteria bacterium]|nr:3-dehydroquinate synthase [Gammaproteobacteria bacterium]MDH5801737.1 3-dehydroquinate synthase [Gammaproteobacteria bacterium]